MRKHLLIYFALGTMVLTACQKDPVGDEEDAKGCPLVEEFVKTVVVIDKPTTWTAGKVYLFDEAVVEITSELTIEPGVIMKFLNSAINVRPGDGGRIVAEGTADKRIVFTSYADNSHCGNTQAAGEMAEPDKGDWGGLYINGGNDHRFTYCDFLYAGGNISESGSTAVSINTKAGDAFTFDHCTFAHTYSSRETGTDISHYAFRADFIVDKPNPDASTFTNNVFYDNDKPMSINPYLPVDASNKFHNPADPTQKNDRNFIHLFAVNHQYGDVTWGHTEVPYVVTGFFHGPRERQHTITIGPNVVVKFPGVSGGIGGYPESRVINLHSTAVLTSYLDDAHGGDSNGDGNASSPAKGDWLGFRIDRPAPAKNEWRSGDNILYAAK